MPSPSSPRAANLAWAAAFSDSDLTARDYATAAGCSVAKLYYWRAQLRQQDTAPAFTAITLRDPAPDPTIFLRLADGTEVHGPCDQLAAFVRQLRRRA